jgi:competence protein ComEA
LIVGSVLCLILLTAFAGQVLGRAVQPPQLPPGERINPNEAPVASLARLPGIGVARARAIVAFRDNLRSQGRQDPAFQCAEDLSKIRGIGPTTLAGIRPWLRFDPPTR